YARALVRTLLRLVYWIGGLGVLAVLDALAALRDPTFHETWHDRSARSVVVRVAPVPDTSVPSRLRTVLGTALVAGWTCFLLSTFFEPMPNPDVMEPWWAGLVFGLFAAALVGAAVAGARGRWRLGLGSSVAASALGLVMAYQCAATAHHAAGWWIYELSACGCLGALSLACLAVRGGRR